MTNNKIVEYKEWDSIFFDQTIYTMDMNCFQYNKAEMFLGLSNALIQSRIPAYKTEIIDKAQEVGFTFVESEICFTKDIIANNYVNSEEKVCIAQLENIGEIQELAARSFIHSRFRYPWFKKADSSRFYAEWGKKAVLQQYDDVCLTIESSPNNSIVGMVSAKKMTDNEARIGLICVSKAFQGKHQGTILLAGIENWAFNAGIKKIHVATQGANQRACNFYLRHNYFFNATNYWFYKRVL